VNDPRRAEEGGNREPAAGFPDQIDRYRIEGEIARGGMGVVLRAHDPDLNRPLAIKVLLQRHQGHPGKVQRFQEEAQITGQLQHPGIPPVHEVGTLDDGRPFLAMRLIHGRTLDALLRDRVFPAADLPRFLTIFEHVCQAVAYAHSRGVVHRDLKPANVMVGEFGEVQVMDWGLARTIGAHAGDTEVRAVDTVRIAFTGSASDSGRAVGTPLYIAPEQARGEEVDERADVFGLGAILCVILTGQAPHGPAPPTEAVRRAAAGDLSEAHTRLDSCGADPDLVRLARACLAPQPGQRLVNAGAVARAVAEYQEGVSDRLRCAEVERARVEVGVREERTRRRLTVWLATLLLVLAGLSAGVVWVTDRERAEVRAAQQRQAEQAGEAAQTALVRMEELRRAARWQEADAVLAGALGRVAEGPPELRRPLERARAELTLTRELDSARSLAAMRVQGRRRLERADRAYGKVFARRDLDVRADPAGVARVVRASAVRPWLVAALDDWAATTSDQRLRRRLLVIARKADPDPWKDRVRDPDAESDRAALDRLVRECDLVRTAPELLAGLAGQLQARGADGLTLLRRAQREHPGDFWLNLALGNALHDQPGRLSEAIGYYRAAVGIRPGSAVAQANLADLLLRRGDADGASAAARRAVALDPANAGVHATHGYGLLEQGRPEEARAAFRRAVDLDGTLAEAHSGLGLALAALGDLPAGRDALQRGVALGPGVASVHDNLGIVLLKQGDLRGAIAAFRRASDLDGAVPTAHLGTALLRQEAVEEAMAAFRRALACDPHHARARAGLGQALQRKGRLEEAIVEYRLASVLDDKESEYPQLLANALESKGDRAGALAALRRVAELRPDSPAAQTNLGAALFDSGDLPGAEAALKRARALDERIALVHYNLGLVLTSRRDPDGAMAAYRRALELNPREARALVNLGLLFFRRGDAREAIRLTQQAVAIDPALVQGHINLGNYLRSRGHFAEAVAASSRALELLGKDDPKRQQVVRQLQAGQRWLAIDSKLPLVLQGKQAPAGDEERLALADLCRRHRGLLAAAARLYAAAFGGSPHLVADPCHNTRFLAACTALQAALGRGKDAAGLEDWQRSDLRGLALDWLTADLHLLAGLAGRNLHAVRAALGTWQGCPDLAAVREPAGQARLPEAEAQAWRELWARVAALLDQVK
jgi:tetratricopeptide (TPR) repeat protein